jgi:glutamine amidotransferase
MIAIVDYGLGNVRAFASIFASLSVPFVIATTPEQLGRASKAILPGVGAFDQAIRRLRQSGMREPLDKMVLQRKAPVLGVCVGMQILADRSEEGREPGLGWISGEVIRFRPAPGSLMQIPHMGWNDVRALRPANLFRGFEGESPFYFLHSYLLQCQRQEDVLATTCYGAGFACAVARENIFGVQFHPEKSHEFGIRLLKNFAEL